MCPRQFACRRPMLDPLAPLALATARSALVLVRAPTASRRREAVGSIGRVQHRGSTSPGPRWRLPDGRREAMRVAPPLAAASPGIAEASVRLGVTLATDDDQQSAAASRWLLLSRHCDHARRSDLALALGAYRARRASPLSGANVPALTRERDSRRIARSALFLATSRAQRTASHDPGMAASTLAKAAVSALRRRDFPIAALRAARPDDRFCRWPTRSGSRRRAPLERRRRCVRWPVMDSCFRPPGAGSSSAAGTVSHGERAVTLRELETRVWARSRSRATRQNPCAGASRDR